MTQKPKKQLNNYIKFTTIAFQMIATIGLLSFVGWWLDSKFPNEYSAYTVIFSLLGVILAIYQVIKQVIGMSKDK
ncbi:AtpZ/AtpI family protein [Lacinutrix neustonica]|uniref:AtpZ/AtpI family protein n=1 Tax=Lacinutrix neustonica TaxID=2980107 RepID=A0A9E8MVN1_9FLAO|nr:AtpZ/AtpI family protein [Lacinutrix neustonica]WAC01109.1 AtpZ/AtpI family protein [Lacinutrix neustonica]